MEQERKGLGYALPACCRTREPNPIIHTPSSTSGALKELGRKRDKIRRCIRELMKEHKKLDKAHYSHRMSVVEPVFANIGTQKRLDRFSLRGKEKVQCQWRYCLVHNIENLMNYGAIT